MILEMFQEVISIGKCVNRQSIVGYLENREFPDLQKKRIT